jgi:hypothetical protein
MPRAGATSTKRLDRAVVESYVGEADRCQFAPDPKQEAIRRELEAISQMEAAGGVDNAKEEWEKLLLWCRAPAESTMNRSQGNQANDSGNREKNIYSLAVEHLKASE